jgi:hypothetical protein
MTEPRLLQNFSGGRAIVVTDRASSLDVLTTTLDRLGVTTNPADIVGSIADIDLATLQPDRSIVFIDGDISDGLYFRLAQSVGCRRHRSSGCLASARPAASKH